MIKFGDDLDYDLDTGFLDLYYSGGLSTLIVYENNTRSTHNMKKRITTIKNNCRIIFV